MVSIINEQKYLWINSGLSEEKQRQHVFILKDCEVALKCGTFGACPVESCPVSPLGVLKVDVDLFTEYKLLQCVIVPHRRCFV